MEGKRIATPEERRSYTERYLADEICVDRGHDKKRGEPCQDCIDDDAGIPMVLRPSIPEDMREPPPTPPYARCVEDHSLPENAGRYPAPLSEDSDQPVRIAPDSSGIMETIKDLTGLRHQGGRRRSH